VHTIEQRSARQRRRRHSAEFKAEAINACRQPGMSIAAAAMARSINANLLRRWITEAEGEGSSIGQEAQKAAPAPPDAFISLPAPIRSQPSPPIQIEVRRGSLTVTMQWPTSALHECIVWLREVLK
jgi:transposase